MSVLRPVLLTVPPVLLVGAAVAVQFLPWRVMPGESDWLSEPVRTPLHDRVHDAYGYPLTVLRVARFDSPGEWGVQWNPLFALADLAVAGVAVTLAAFPLMLWVRDRRAGRLDWEAVGRHHGRPPVAPGSSPST